MDLAGVLGRCVEPIATERQRRQFAASGTTGHSGPLRPQIGLIFLQRLTRVSATRRTVHLYIMFNPAPDQRTWLW